MAEARSLSGLIVGIEELDDQGIDALRASQNRMSGTSHLISILAEEGVEVRILGLVVHLVHSDRWGGSRYAP